VQACHEVFFSIHLFTHPQHSRSAVLFGICGLTAFVHACECAALLTGCRGPLERQKD
jgi:hypothetical protein